MFQRSKSPSMSVLSFDTSRHLFPVSKKPSSLSHLVYAWDALMSESCISFNSSLSLSPLIFLFPYFDRSILSMFSSKQHTRRFMFRYCNLWKRERWERKKEIEWKWELREKRRQKKYHDRERERETCDGKNDVNLVEWIQVAPSFFILSLSLSVSVTSLAHSIFILFFLLINPSIHIKYGRNESMRKIEAWKTRKYEGEEGWSILFKPGERSERQFLFPSPSSVFSLAFHQRERRRRRRDRHIWSSQLIPLIHDPILFHHFSFLLLSLTLVSSNSKLASLRISPLFSVLFFSLRENIFFSPPLFCLVLSSLLPDAALFSWLRHQNSPEK